MLCLYSPRLPVCGRFTLIEMLPIATTFNLQPATFKGLLVPGTPRSLLVYRGRSHLLGKELQKRLGRAV